jgi:hypothetical protein
MRHLLMDPAFPDIVGCWAAQAAAEMAAKGDDSANDNQLDAEALSDPLWAVLARLEVDESRVW